MDKRLKTLFVNFALRPVPDNFPPYGALSVINALKKAGYKNTFFYNQDVLRPTREQAFESISAFKPDILCMSAPVSTAYESAKAFSLEIKKRLPDVRIILGGNLAASAEILLNKTGIDFCVIGEGERACVDLFHHLDQDRPLGELRDVKGLAFLDGGELVTTGYADQLSKEELYDIDWDVLDSESVKHYFPLIEDIDPDSITFKYFFYHILRNKKQDDSILNRMLNKSVGTIICSKGCVARCSFCHRFNHGIRTLPVEILKERIEAMVEKFNIGVISFGDECFGANLKWLDAFCEMIKPMNLLWKVGGMRVNKVNPEIIHKMRDAGCQTIIYGMETGSKGMLKVMEKGVKSEDNYNAIKWTVEAGLFTIPQLVIGMPGETTETIQETADFVAYGLSLDRRQNPNHLSINFAQALPGTPLYEYARMAGMIGTTLDEEEQYLLQVSDREAGDETTTLNFTDYPGLIQRSWPLLIFSTVFYHYARNFGIDHYYKVIFKDRKRPGLLQMILGLRISLLTICYPKLTYQFRRFLWIKTLYESIRKKGIGYGIQLFIEFVGFFLSKRKRANRQREEYKSLRKILAEDFKNAYSGREGTEILRKGR